MYKFKRISKTYETETISEVTCDCCGKNIDINNKNNNGEERYVCVNLCMENTFFSENPKQLQLCNDCVRTLYLSMNFKCENDKYYKNDVDYYFDKDDDFNN